MSHENNAFTQELTRPYADQGELPLLIQAQAEDAHEDSWDEPALTVRLTQSSRLNAKRVFWASTILFILAFMTYAILGGLKAYRTYSLQNAVTGFDIGSDALAIEKSRTAKEKILLYGDSAASSEAERWKALWDLDPTKPAYAIPYFEAYFKENGHFPPEVTEFRKQHDPNNSWYDLREAAHLAEQSITRIRPTHSLPRTPSSAHPISTFKITDQKKYNEE